MTIPKWLKLAVPCLAVTGLAATGALLAINNVACSKLTFLPVTDGGGATGGACTADAGQFPAPDCESAETPLSCPNTGTCVINQAECGSITTCMPMDDNSGKTQLDFRMRRLTVVTPQALAQTFIQQSVVDNGINLGIPACGEANGTGAFSWLIRIDTSTNSFMTGGAPPLANPLTDAFSTGSGYCWARQNVVQGPGTIAVAPIVGTVTKGADGTYASNVIPKINIPIYVHGMASDVVVLPISQAQVLGVTITDDGNCIGSFNYAALDGMCNDQRLNCSRWHTAGALGGYITLKEADSVLIEDLGNESLCALLTADAMPSADGKHCATDSNGNVLAKGDFCSTTDSAGGCQDSYWLAATFAASAIKIDDSPTNPLCLGAGDDGGAPDSGDAGSGDASDASDAASSD